MSILEEFEQEKTATFRNCVECGREFFLVARKLTCSEKCSKALKVRRQRLGRATLVGKSKKSEYNRRYRIKHGKPKKLCFGEHIIVLASVWRSLTKNLC